jgi:hypothetical protein
MVERSMLGNSHRVVPATFFEDPKEDDAFLEAIGQFRSALIIAYDQALKKGMSSGSALAAIFDWMSLEFERTAHIDD